MSSLHGLPQIEGRLSKCLYTLEILKKGLDQEYSQYVTTMRLLFPGKLEELVHEAAQP